MKSPAQPPLWNRLIRLETLWPAWLRVHANDGAAGGDGVGQAAFARTAPQRVARLAHELAGGHYRPGPYRRIAIPKRDGGERMLAIPCIADRVVQTAAATLMGAVLDPSFSSASFAYRPGRGVARAVQAVLRHRRDGYVWTAEGDVARCFDEIPHAALTDALDARLGEPRLTDLVALWLEDYDPRGIGIPQGAPISPLLANLHLDTVDRAISGSGVRLVRYADDFVILAKSAGRAEAGLMEIAKLLRRHGLDLNPEKSRIIPADGTLEFLGHVFIRSMAWRAVNDESQPPAPPDAPPEEDLARWRDLVAEEAAMEAEQPDPRPSRRRTLHLVEPGTVLDVRNDAFVVLSPPGADGKRQGRLIEHARRLDRIEIGPGASADWSAVQLAAAWDVPIASVDSSGATLAWLGHPGDLRGRRIAAQARWLADEGRRADLATAIVRGRIAGQAKRLRKFNLSRRNPDISKAAVDLVRLAKRLREPLPPASARAREGEAARIYWAAWARVLPPGWPIAGRQRNPAPDAVNAALNFLFWLLLRDIGVALGRAGLHPGIAALHEPRDGGDPLVWDLVEAFRAAGPEMLVPALIGRKVLRQDMFKPTDGGDIRIDRDGRRALIRAHEAWLARPVKSRRSGLFIGWRALFEEEARALADLFVGEADGFTPYAIDW